MDIFQYELLKGVKEKYELAGGRADYECSEGGPDKSARQFYVRDLRDNLVRPHMEQRCSCVLKGGNPIGKAQIVPNIVRSW